MEAVAPKSNTRRDFLRDIETNIQAKWEALKVNEIDAPADYSHLTFEEKSNEKFFNTFPYPYMNGRLHLGHAYSMSKNEFASRFQKMQGKRVLFPFAFHCTGMPIAAAAKRLVLEKQPDEESKEEAKEKKITQAEILISMGVPKEDIEKFENPEFWLDYFTPRGIQDLKTYGICADWRRSFYTTSKNPYYDSFIRWQFNILKAKDKVVFGKRPAIYSIRDGQPCADHDRAEGEGVVPQEYTLIKMKMLEFPEEMKEFEGKNVFLVAATLRPETMYGQTNCFVLPEGKYGIYRMPGDEYFVCSERSMTNMAYQEMTHEYAQSDKVGTVKGSSLIGVPLKAPLTKYEKVYTLPLLTISMTKGTGVVTSVPSDAPNDYAALMDFKEKADMREKYGVDEAWVKDYEPIPIIDIPPEETKEGVADGETISMIAVDLCKKMKIKSQKDIKKLDEAKEIAYKKGFFSGIFSIGEYKGMKVSEAKDKVKDNLIQSGDALKYFEPEKKVVSRSRDECIVAKVDQWLLRYGEEEWRKFVRDFVTSDDFTTFFKATQKSFVEVIDWLKEWGLSRTFGLGTRVPWDEQFVIESLSDSTIYMAYYTVAHYLQGGVVSGSTPGPLGITPEQMTHEVWDYIFLGKDYPEDWTIPKESLDKMRNEFEYWYPLDLRCSGKDLIGNHLIMCLYNHAAIWEDKSKMPRSMFCNGYMLLNDMPMSKKTGNFLTLIEACEKYSASGARMTVADAGDTLDDGNFRESVANSAIMKQFVFGKWIEEELAKINLEELDWNNYEETFDEYDKMFDNEMNRIIKITHQMYAEMKFKLALKFGFHDLQGVRDDYVIFKQNKLNPYLVLKFIEIQLLLVTPIIPHFCEHFYGSHFLPAIMKTKSHREYPELIINARWPKQEKEYDSTKGKILSFIKYCKHHFIVMYDKMSGHRKEQKMKQKKNTANKKKAQPAQDQEDSKEKPTESDTAMDVVEKKNFENCIIFYANQYPEEQQTVIKILQQIGYDDDLNPKDNPVNILKEKFTDKKELGKIMKFATFMNDCVKETRSFDVLDLETSYNVKEIIEQHTDFIFGDLKLKNIDFKEKNEKWELEGWENSILAAAPGKPSIFFY